MSAYASGGRSSGGGRSSFSLGWDSPPKAQPQAKVGSYGGAGTGPAVPSYGMRAGGQGNAQFGAPPPSNPSFAMGRLGSNQSYGSSSGPSHYGGGVGGATGYRDMPSRERKNPFSNAARASMSAGIYQPGGGHAAYQPPAAYGSGGGGGGGHGAYQPQSSAISSNAYANGSNQNAGNVMTGRSSTKRLAPPGGASSFSIGWGGGGGHRASAAEQAPPRTHVSAAPSRDYAPAGQATSSFSKHNNNYGGVSLTSLPGKRTSSTSGFMAPTVGDNYTVGVRRNSYNSTYQPPQDQFRSQHQPMGGGGGGGHGAYQAPQSSAISSNAYATGSNQNAGNVMTGRSSTKRLAPPGGHSSFHLG